MSDRNTSVDQRSPAEIYDEQFVPALFRPWSARGGRCRAASARDSGCSTSPAARACSPAPRPSASGATGSVVGLDANPQMLAVARRKAPDVEWRRRPGRGAAVSTMRSFDAVVSQFGLMFFEDRVKALREMMRVLRPGGRLAVAVWDALDHSPGYMALADAAASGCSATRWPTRFARRSCWAIRRCLRSLCDEAGLARAVGDGARGHRALRVDRGAGRHRARVAWTLGGLLDDAQFEQLLSGPSALRPFAQADGKVAFRDACMGDHCRQGLTEGVRHGTC